MAMPREITLFLHEKYNIIMPTHFISSSQQAARRKVHSAYLKYFQHYIICLTKFYGRRCAMLATFDLRLPPVPSV